MPDGSPSPLLRCVPSASRHAKQLWWALGSDIWRMYAIAVPVDSTGAAMARNRDFLMTSSQVTSCWSVVMPAEPAVLVRARLLPARASVTGLPSTRAPWARCTGCVRHICGRNLRSSLCRGGRMLTALSRVRRRSLAKSEKKGRQSGGHNTLPWVSSRCKSFAIPTYHGYTVIT